MFFLRNTSVSAWMGLEKFTNNQRRTADVMN